MSGPLYTIGHSVHAIEHFCALLRQHGVSLVCDVRSHPYSRMNPQYNRETLIELLQLEGIGYLFLGKELGARSGDPSCYTGGKVQYDRLARGALFQQGLGRVFETSEEHTPALMCAEKDPLECHRTILVARHVVDRGAEVRHILEDGSIETHEACLARLLRDLKMQEYDLFRSREEVIADAYRLQGERIAYAIETVPPGGEAQGGYIP